MQTSDLWLALDIGNSAAKGAYFDGDSLLNPFRLELTRQDAPEAWAEALKVELDEHRPARVGVASVVPQVNGTVQDTLAHIGLAAPLLLRHDVRLPFVLDYETPHTLGIDRLVAAAAAWTLYGRDAAGQPRNVVALDAGTAVTGDVIDRGGVYRGGFIAAGPSLVQEALNRGTAQLPRVPLELPASPIGRSTKGALQAGIMYAFLDAVQGALVRISEALDGPPIVVATGGWSTFLSTHLHTVHHVDPHLVLRGIRVLMALNTEPERLTV